MTYRFETLEILITNKGIKPVQFSKFPSNSVFTNKGAKIYIVMKDKETVYVGKTLQQIGTKLGQGFRAYQNAKNKGIRISGYGGYKWTSMFENKTLKLLVFNFGEVNKDSDKANEFIEAIEAEIVFQIRNRSEKWPIGQNEIHFNNTNKNAEKLALNILRDIK
jgi:hypothetical protein